MKKLCLIAFAVVGLLVISCNTEKSVAALVTQEKKALPDNGKKLEIDTVRSLIRWKASHKGGFAPRWGTVSIQSGEVHIDGDQISGGKFIIDMNSIKVNPASVKEKNNTAAELQAHLKSPDFFDTVKNPISDFKITSVKNLETKLHDAVPGANKMISGNLTLSGKTVNVSFPAKVEATANKASIQAKFTIDRTELGIKFGTSEADPAEWMISKNIKIDIDVKI